jgi:hypothetical protein
MEVGEQARERQEEPKKDATKGSKRAANNN